MVKKGKAAKTSTERKGNLIQICAQSIELWDKRDDKKQTSILKALQLFKEDEGFEVTEIGRYIVDCDAVLTTPLFKGLAIKRHSKGGKVCLELRKDDNLYIDGRKVVLHSTKKQIANEEVLGHEVGQELSKSKLVLLNVNILVYLENHPFLIPYHWRGNAICFWGNIFQREDGDLCVPCLCLLGYDTWYLQYHELSFTCNSHYVAAVLKMI